MSYAFVHFVFVLLTDGGNDRQRACTCHFFTVSGSLIPRKPFGGGRAATQSASRDSLVVQYWLDYKVANRLVWLDIVLPSKFPQRHAQHSSDKREKEDVKRNNYIREVNPIDDLFLLYKAIKALI